MTESIIIVGAGITGLGTALALAKSGRKVTLLERDPPPPETSADDAFDVWERKGVGHLRHSHAFLAVLYGLIKREYPALLDQLVEAGCRELKFADGLSGEVRKTYVPQAEDDNLTILSSRRTTLEYVIRRFVDELDGVTLEADVLVRDVVLEEQNGAKVVTGLEIEMQGASSKRFADIIVDAGGRNSQLVPWLIKKGVDIPESEDHARIMYYTRHYRLNDGCDEPEPGMIPGAGDLRYIKYGVFPADHGCFSVTFALPEVETEMRKSIQRLETFDALCENLPGLARWTDPERSRPVGKVLSMGDIRATWRSFLEDDRPKVLGFFAVGDSAIRTNPLYGRGCSFGFLQGHALAEALQESDDPATRAVLFHGKVEETVRPFFKDMVNQDQNAVKQAQRLLTPGYKPGLGARLAKSFAEDAVTIVLRSDADILRQAMRAFHMVDKPNVWLRKPGTIWAIAKAWMTPKAKKAHLYSPKIGPGRQELYEAVGLSWETDLIKKTG